MTESAPEGLVRPRSGTDQSAAYFLLRAAREISYSQAQSLPNNRFLRLILTNRPTEVSGLRGEALRPRDFSHRRTDAKSLVSFFAFFVFFVADAPDRRRAWEGQVTLCVFSVRSVRLPSEGS